MAGTQSNLFNTGIGSVILFVNRGSRGDVAGVSAPTYMPQQANDPPDWDNGGPSTGNLGPGNNQIQLKTGGRVLPSLTINLPAVSTLAVQTYLFWIMDKDTFETTFLCAVMSQGQIIGSSSVQGFAPPDSGS
ncbi:MAG TPA: hypothetical protein VEK57_29590 [Thermoanaerobaculia bacterium]|nr:hypothetical protein [Thermoanaerobaculia bacterium]